MGNGVNYSLNCVARLRGSILGFDCSDMAFAAAAYSVLVRSKIQLTCGVSSLVTFARDGSACPESRSACGVVRLVKCKRDDQRRHSGTQSLRSSSDTAVMDHRNCLRQQRLIRRIVNGNYVRRQWVRRRLRSSPIKSTALLFSKVAARMLC